MSAAKPISYDAVLRIVSDWPSEKRLSLVQDVLQTLVPDVKGTRAPCRTLEKALGLLATGQPASSDVEVQHWLNERRAVKYG
jgi:hypothetical protein